MFKIYLLFLVCGAYIFAAENITTYTYKTVGDLKIELDVYTPLVAAPEHGYPVFLAIHGGTYVVGSKWGAFTGKELTEVMNRGWVMVSIDYRLFPGALLEETIEDVQDAYQWVRTELVKTTPINPNMVTVFGQSAGGGLAVLSGCRLSPRPQVIIGFYSRCTNWTDPFVYDPNTGVDLLFAAAANKLSVPVLAEYNGTSLSDPRTAFSMAAQANAKMGWLAVTHDPNLSTQQVLAELRKLSATENVDQDYPPTYLAHGSMDVVVPYLQSVQLADQLKQNNIPYVLDVVPGANHWFDTSARFWDEHVLPAFDFAEKYMQGSTTKISI